MSTATLELAKAEQKAAHAKAPECSGRIRYGWPALVLYALATLQTAAFYLWRVRPYLHLEQYENGTAHMPFQGRILLAPMLRWAHHNGPLTRFALYLSQVRPWFPRGMHGESLIEAILSVISLAVTGAVATALYNAASDRKLFAYAIYPFTLVLFVWTYILQTTQNLRFPYDLPSLAFFAVGIYLIYFHKPVIWFALLFMVATINRETALILLLYFALERATGSVGFDRRALFRKATLAVIVPLAAYWVAWRIIIHHQFAANPSEGYSRYFVNFPLLLIPFAWPQMLGACCYLLPIVFVFRKFIPNRVLRTWVWVLPIWLLLMFRFGILVENRIFGELIPYVACAAPIIAEQLILRQLGIASAS